MKKVSYKELETLNKPNYIGNIIFTVIWYTAVFFISKDPIKSLILGIVNTIQDSYNSLDLPKINISAVIIIPAVAFLLLLPVICIVIKIIRDAEYRDVKKNGLVGTLHVVKCEDEDSEDGIIRIIYGVFVVGSNKMRVVTGSPCFKKKKVYVKDEVECILCRDKLIVTGWPR